VDRVQIVDASTRLLASIWFSQPRHMTVVTYSLSPFGLTGLFKRNRSIVTAAI
jgi:hypothetical protein